MTEQSVDTSLYHDPQRAALAADVLNVSGEEPGFQRKRRGKGFMYCDEQGHCVRDSVLLARFKALVIPPGWTAVWICIDANGHIQATGRDEQGVSNISTIHVGQPCVIWLNLIGCWPLPRCYQLFAPRWQLI